MATPLTSSASTIDSGANVTEEMNANSPTLAQMTIDLIHLSLISVSCTLRGILRRPYALGGYKEDDKCIRL